MDVPDVVESFDGPVPPGRPPYPRRRVTSRITRFLPGQYLTWVPGPVPAGVWFSLPDALQASRVATESAVTPSPDDLVASAHRHGTVPVRRFEAGAEHVLLSPEIPRSIAHDRITVLLPHVPELSGLIGEAADFFGGLSRVEAEPKPWRIPAPLAGGVARQAFEVLATLWSGVTGERVETVVRGPDGTRLAPVVRHFAIGRRQLATLAAANDVIQAVSEPQIRLDTDLPELLGLIGVAWPSQLVDVLESYDADAEQLAALISGEEIVLTDRAPYDRLSAHWSQLTLRR
ncbi:MAG: hypothetical protein QOI21_3967 [Actinomycetota bacterium]|nr:hypothetical protein [Actinomycetota bacterium]